MVSRGCFVVLFHCLISLSWTSENSEHKEKKYTRPCYNEDELLNLCTDPIETCHEERGDEIKLVRIEGVKVC